MKPLGVIGLVLLAVVAAFVIVRVSIPDMFDDGWVRSAPNAQGLTFAYPDPFPGTNVSTAEWPPVIEMTAGEYACAADGAATDGPFSSVHERIIDGRTYCVREMREGAAGSTFVTYEYATARDGAILRAVFTLRFVQCGNYDEPQMDACAAEQAAFDVDALASRIMESIESL
jgi:hypothetical protein